MWHARNKFTVSCCRVSINIVARCANSELTDSLGDHVPLSPGHIVLGACGRTWPSANQVLRLLRDAP
eukprot:15448691-Alexandrium_andersonii.AAC.1